jgi:tetratricopeptide (TPR) repeat protein
MGQRLAILGFCSISLMLSSYRFSPDALAPKQIAQANLEQQARLAFKEGRYAEAEALWRKVVAEQPNSAEAFYQLGFSLHLQEEIGSAIAAYRQAIALNPNYDAPHMNLGLALIELQQLDEAIPSFERVLALPDQPETPASTHTLAHYNLAIIHKRQNRPDMALQAVDAALKITPDLAPAQELRLQLLDPQRRQESRSDA